MSIEIDTRIIDNFLSDNEIEEINYQSNLLPGFRDKDSSDEKLWDAELISFTRNNVWDNEVIENILKPKFIKHFGKECVLNEGHVLISRIPYKIHTDARASFGLPSETHKAGWTFIIPLETCDSATILFDQHASDTIYEIYECIEKFNWVKQKPIDDDIKQKYLTHLTDFEMDYFTIKSIFDWKKGTMFAAPRINFHCSDNFPSRGVTSKKAIVVWTTVPKD